MFLIGSIYWTLVLLPVKIFADCLIELEKHGWLGNIFTTVLPSVLVPFFNRLSIQSCLFGIYLSFILSKYVTKWNARTIEICKQFRQNYKSCISVSVISLTFETFNLPWPDVGHILLHLRQKCLSLPTNRLVRYQIRPIHFRNKNLHYHFLWCQYS